MSAEKIVKDGVLGMGVQTTKDIIKNNHGPLSIHCSCQTDSLTLTSTENNTLAAYNAKISFGQLSEVLF